MTERRWSANRWTRPRRTTRWRIRVRAFGSRASRVVLRAKRARALARRGSSARRRQQLGLGRREAARAARRPAMTYTASSGAPARANATDCARKGRRLRSSKRTRAARQYAAARRVAAGSTLPSTLRSCDAPWMTTDTDHLNVAEASDRVARVAGGEGARKTYELAQLPGQYADLRASSARARRAFR